MGGLGAFNYTPPIARLFDPVGVLPWFTFLWLWLAVLVAQIVWLGGRSWRVVWILALPPVALELYHGNVHLIMAAAIALGYRYPWTWAFVILTKVTPGVGLVWFAVRREWRPLGIALGVTGAIVAVSLVVDGSLWVDWWDFIRSTPEGGSVTQPQIPVPLWLRLPAAVVLVAWGARTDRRWTVPLAATLALPVLWPAGLRDLRRDAASGWTEPRSDGPDFRLIPARPTQPIPCAANERLRLRALAETSIAVLTLRDRMPRTRLDVVFVVVLVSIVLIRIPGLGYPLTESHAFRQTQTAFPAAIFVDEGIDLLRPKVPVSDPHGSSRSSFRSFKGLQPSSWERVLASRCRCARSHSQVSSVAH